MILAHLIWLFLIEQVAELLELVRDTHSELEVVPLAMKSLHVHLDLGPDIFSL